MGPERSPAARSADLDEHVVDTLPVLLLSCTGGLGVVRADTAAKCGHNIVGAGETDQLLQCWDARFDTGSREVSPFRIVGPRPQFDVDPFDIERPRHEPIIVGHPDRDPHVFVQPSPRVHHGAEQVGCADVESGEIRELVELVAERLRDAQRDQPVVAEPERKRSPCRPR